MDGLDQLEVEQMSYHVLSTSLPCDLPTRAEIALSEDILSDQIGCKVVGVGPHYVVKYGSQLKLSEGETMLHVAQSTRVRTPHLYALYHDPSDNKNYIIMERISGKNLKQLWQSLNESEKASIALQLKTSVDELRLLPSPGHYCGVHNSPLPDALFGSDGGLEDNDGPFDSEDQLNNALIKTYTSSEVLSKGKAKFYERAWRSIFTAHTPVFTHGDFQRKNIMVTEDLNVVLIDWEYAGWYPDYWEYARAVFACTRFDDDWSFWLEKVLTPYLNEYAWMYILMLELWS